METPVLTSLNICMTSDIPKSNFKSQYLGLPSYQCLEMKYHLGYDPIQFPIQYMETPVSASLKIGKTSDIPQSNTKACHHINIYKWTRRIWPNPISNPIHGHPCFGTFEDRQGLRYTPIQFQIPILRFVIISISRNDITHRIWPNPISNPIHGNLCFDIFEHTYAWPPIYPIQFQIPILRLAILSMDPIDQ